MPPVENIPSTIARSALIALLTTSSLWARPLITEDVQTVGKYSFEASFGISQRNDEFGDPDFRYETVVIPVTAQFGLSSNIDIGIELQHISHRIITPNNRLGGSKDGLYSPYLKFSPSKRFGVLGIWHAKAREVPDQNLPIARGNDVEIIGLYRFPVSWPLFFNAGYVLRDPYVSRLGVKDEAEHTIRPGDILESSLSVEVPLKFRVSFLLETAYYHVGRKTVDSQTLPDSSGDALDVLVGTTWAKGGWNVGLGGSFGLLDESHTSFDLFRGSGDARLQAKFSYRLKPRKPESWR